MAGTQSANEASTTLPFPTRNTQVPATLMALDSHSLQITQYKLNGTNFQESSQSVLLVVRGKGKAGYLIGAVPKPNTDSTTYGIWDTENFIVMAWLVNSKEPKIGRIYLFYKTT